MKRSTRMNVLAFLLIAAPAANALADFLQGDVSIGTALGAAMTGSIAAAITFLISPPKIGRQNVLPLPPGSSER